MRHVFGPVPSWRLGRSLGVDPVPLKTCNWNCIYCQLGRSRPMIDTRKVWVPVEDLVREVMSAVRAHAGDIDWITVVGSGEPTLHSELGAVIRSVHARTDIPIAVITNGSLLHMAEVRRHLKIAQAVLPSLDAGDAELYRRIARPLGSASFERLVEGLVQFRAEYRGALWVEVMLVRGVNDSDEALERLCEVLERVRPHQIHLNVPTRPPAEPWVEAPTPARLAHARARLARVAPTFAPKTAHAQIRGPQSDLPTTLLEVVTRHPMTIAELSGLLPAHAYEQVQAAIAQLEADGHVTCTARGEATTWHATASWFPQEHRTPDER